MREQPTRVSDQRAIDDVLLEIRRGLSLHVEIEATDGTGLDDTSYVQCELVRSVNRSRLVHRLGAVDLDTSRRVAGIVRTLLSY